MEVYTNKSFLQYENVALKKPAYMSTPDSTYIANNCVDGSKGNNNLCKLTTETTPFKNWFIVDLTRNYQVLYAVLYTFDLQGMEGFIVGLSNTVNQNSDGAIRGTYDNCTTGPITYSASAQPLRVDCNYGNNTYRYVIVQQSTTKATSANRMTFSELEVYGSENTVYKYVGCFRTFQKQATFHESSLDICITLCKEMNYPYATIRERHWCFCAAVAPTDLYPSSSCFSYCNSVTGVCDETDLNAVYSTQPSPGYMGCYLDAGSILINRDLNLKSVQMSGTLTIEKCLTYCLENGFSYAGVQSSAFCNCGNTYGKYGKISENICNAACFATNSGQDKAAHKSTIVPLQTASLLLNFYRIYFRKIEDCNVNNGDCGIHPCSSFQIGSTVMTECVCRIGYMKYFYNDYCQLVNNVCNVFPNLCNNTISSCIVVGGDYLCNCTTGYQHPTNSSNNNTICIDIDECATSNPCNSTNEYCLNTIGSYQCLCRPGYQLISSSCQDVNECLNVGTNVCDAQTSTCVNQIGTYSCSCFKGFANKNKWTCEDLDECLTDTHSCNSSTSSCVNNVGTYSCLCNSGYFNKDQHTCEVSQEKSVLFAFIAIFSAVLLTLIGFFSYCTASNQFKYAPLNREIA
ncbi:hypothetical protein HELRODRAFT_184132 [Helobdella robusta]|uniref:WSC domain-containing protein n=1 Tax=Helobdella robusta TaxID=6412 RepID=T1FKM9_HELRO|nr:hypothetical protein HELRODRAFT_184132 [Helobdella robusta]ESO07454.1 hypothetical protein HELRODRAFT_184132 [Helobdella robusta]